MNIWLVEIWHAWRASLRRPGFLLLASSVLALGVGASAAVFTLIDNVLLRPLPYMQPERLLALGRDYNGLAVSPLQYQHLQSLQGVTSMGLVMNGTPPVNISGDGIPEQVSGMRVDRGLLPTLGVRMALGRNFSAEEDRPNGVPAVILAHGFWQRRYGGDPHVVGHSMQVEGVVHTIVGVLPASFTLLGHDDIMLPLALPANSDDDGTNYLAVARMADGTDAKAVGAQVNARLRSMYEGVGAKGWQQMHFGASELQITLRGTSRPTLMLFLASALFVLLIALVNLTNLMLLRTLSRSHEHAVRNALGASGLRLLLPALSESALIGVLGSALGLLLAVIGLGLLRRFVPVEWVDTQSLRIGGRVIVLVMLVGIAGVLGAATLGLWRGRGRVAIDELREGGRHGLSRHSGRLGRALVIVQVAFATVLLAAAGIFLHALADAARVPLGFQSSGVLTFDMAPVKGSYADGDAVQALVQRVQDRLGAQAGVNHVAVGTNQPVGEQLNLGIQLPSGQDVTEQYRGVGPGYFATFAIPLVQGRTFNAMDRHGAELIAIVNQAFARQYLGGKALDKTLKIEGSAPIRIVGVVGDTRQFGPLQAAPPIVYVPFAQVPNDLLQLIRGFIPLRWAISVSGDPMGYRATVRAAVAEVAPVQPVANLRPLSAGVDESVGDTRLNLLLVGLFAVLSLALAASGIYAVMAVAVMAREREFGVRMALGASPGRVVRTVLEGGLAQIGLGLVVGIAIALAMSRLLGAVLEQIDRSMFDPWVLAAVCVVLVVFGSAACFLPALRAGRVQLGNALVGQ